MIEFVLSHKADIVLIWISTGLGFISAMFVDFITKYLRNKQENIVMINQLLEELESVRSFLHNNKAENNKKMQYYISPYSLAAWNVSIQTGRIANISRYKYYIKVIETFNQISEANQIETMIYKKVFDIKASNDNHHIGHGQLQVIQDYSKYLEQVREKLYSSVIECIGSLEEVNGVNGR